MEEYKNLKEIIELCEEELNNNDENVTATLDLLDLKELRNLINRNKELEKENEHLKTFINEEEDYITELNNKNCELELKMQQDFIPETKVKEKIEELKEEMKSENNEKVIIWLHKQIRILQELLEE